MKFDELKQKVLVACDIMNNNQLRTIQRIITEEEIKREEFCKNMVRDVKDMLNRNILQCVYMHDRYFNDFVKRCKASHSILVHPDYGMGMLGYFKKNHIIAYQGQNWILEYREEFTKIIHGKSIYYNEELYEVHFHISKAKITEL